jgi:hypothetical protein
MSVWTTKSLNKNSNYILIKHNLPHVNNNIMGVKFRDSFAVVDKDSKIYNQLKKVPILKNAQELPLDFLKKLPFITRSSDVKLVYGVDVYNAYIKSITKATKEEQKQKIEEAEYKHFNESNLCHFRYTENINKGQLCQGEKLEESPSQYCFRHLLQDPFIDIKTTMPITREGKIKLTKQILKNIENHIKADSNG